MVRDVKEEEKERCWEKEGKGREREEPRETLNLVVIYKRKVHTFPEVVFVYNRKGPVRLQVRPLLRYRLSRFLMPATMRNNINLILSYSIKLLMDTVNSIGATIGV
jgi:hypothetical protein